MDICETSTFKIGEYDRHPWEIARLKVVKSFLTPILKSLKNPKILDLGCGDVFVASELSKAYPTCDFQCVDTAFTPELIAQITQKVKEKPISLFSSLEEHAEKSATKVDVVLLLDVIEHIEDEISFLKQLRTSDVLHSSTKIVITVPAYQSLFSNHDVYLKHFRRYDTALLADHLLQAGFQVNHTGYFFLSLFLIRKLQKWRQKKEAIDSEKGIGAYTSKGFLDKIVVAVLYTDFLIGKGLRKIGIRLPGLSCFGICQQLP